MANVLLPIKSNAVCCGCSAEDGSLHMKTSYVLILKKNTLKDLAQRSALKSAFCVLYVSQRRLLALSLAIMAGGESALGKAAGRHTIVI